MHYRSRDELIARIEREHDELVRLLGAFGGERFTEPGIWGDGWDVRDLLAHLTEWERMFLRWFRTGCDGGVPELPAPGYTWRETPALNRAIRDRHHGTAVEEVVREFHASYRQVLGLAQTLAEHDLFAPGRFPWTGRNALVAYLGANTASHYATASKILRRALRGVRRPEPQPAATSH